MEAILSVAAATGGLARHYGEPARTPDATKKARAPDESETTPSSESAIVDVETLVYPPGRAVLHLLTNSAESFKKILSETGDVRTANAVTGFNVDVYG